MADTSNRNKKEYLNGRASGSVHIPNDPLCKANLNKIKTSINDSSRPMVQAYWRGYQDGMNGRNEFGSFYGI